MRLKASRRALQSCCPSVLVSDFLLAVWALCLVCFSSPLLALFSVQPHQLSRKKHRSLFIIIRIFLRFCCSCRSPGGVWRSDEWICRRGFARLGTRDWLVKLSGACPHHVPTLCQAWHPPCGRASPGWITVDVLVLFSSLCLFSLSGNHKTVIFCLPSA